MKVGKINIAGRIGDFTNDKKEIIKGVNLIDIIAQVKAIGEVDSYDVIINSAGGSVQTGFDIADYLQSLKKPLNTIISGLCGSVATVLSLIGDTREIIKGSEYHIHNPWMQVEGDTDHLAEAALLTAEAEKKMINFYADHTGVTKEGIDALMKLDESMPIEKALALGFVTKIIEPTAELPLQKVNAEKVFAFVKIKNQPKNDTMKKKFVESFKTFLAELKIDSKKIFGDDAQDDDAVITLTLADGTTINVADPDGDGVPAVGDVVTDANGAPTPSATYTTKDGATMTTDENSMVLTYTPAAAAQITDDAEFIKQVQEALTGTGIEVIPTAEIKVKRTAIVSALKALATAKKNEQAKTVFAQKKLKDFENLTSTTFAKLKDEIKSNYTPQVGLGFRTKLDEKTNATTADAIKNFNDSKKKRVA